MCYKVQILALQASGREIFAPTSPGLPGMPVGGKEGTVVKGEKRNKRSKSLRLFDLFPEILPKSETKALGSLPDSESNFPTIDYFQTLSL